MTKQIKHIALPTDLQGTIRSFGMDYIIEGLRPGDIVIIAASTTPKAYRLSHRGALNPYSKKLPYDPVCRCKEAAEGEHECPAIDPTACMDGKRHYIRII